jgi:hypothetical protein
MRHCKHALLRFRISLSVYDYVMMRRGSAERWMMVGRVKCRAMRRGDLDAWGCVGGSCFGDGVGVGGCEVCGEREIGDDMVRYGMVWCAGDG